MNRGRREALARRARRRDVAELRGRITGVEILTTALIASVKEINDVSPRFVSGDYEQAVADVAAESVRPVPDGRY